VVDLSLFKLPSFRAGVGGGFIFRVGTGALPFLLPLLLQIGFGRTPFQSGMITLSTAAGAMMMKWAVPRILRRIGFRNALTWNSLIASVMLMACAAFTATTPVAAMVAVLLLGGFFRSLQFTSVNTIAFAEIEPHRMSRGTALVAVAQQLSQSVGVAVGALVVETVLRIRGQTMLTAADFPPAFIVVSLIAASSTFLFATMPPDAGADMAKHRAAKQKEPAEVG
jgi:MFS family permease